MDPKDAEKIRFQSAAWYATESKKAREEFIRMANEVMKAAGLSIN
ncbi:N-acetylmuramoyl-L-alanine amidase [Paenibacillus cisolokensis]